MGTYGASWTRSGTQDYVRGRADDIKHFLVTRNTARRRTYVEEFGIDYDAALRAYQEAERRALGRHDLDVVLLGADSLETIKRTHSSYFELKPLSKRPPPQPIPFTYQARPIPLFGS